MSKDKKYCTNKYIISETYLLLFSRRNHCRRHHHYQHSLRHCYHHCFLYHSHYPSSPYPSLISISSSLFHVFLLSLSLSLRRRQQELLSVVSSSLPCPLLVSFVLLQCSKSSLSLQLLPVPLEVGVGLYNGFLELYHYSTLNYYEGSRML